MMSDVQMNTTTTNDLVSRLAKKVTLKPDGSGLHVDPSTNKEDRELIKQHKAEIRALHLRTQEAVAAAASSENGATLEPAAPPALQPAEPEPVPEAPIPETAQSAPAPEAAAASAPAEPVDPVPESTPAPAAGDLASDHSLELVLDTVPEEPAPTPSTPRLLTDQEAEAFLRESFRMGLELGDTISVLRSFGVELPWQLAAWRLPAVIHALAMRSAEIAQEHLAAITAEADAELTTARSD
jgi:hypothetical protein